MADNEKKFHKSERNRAECGRNRMEANRTRFSAGYNSWRGQLIRGQHEPLVSMADYNRVQRLLAKAATGRKAKCRPREIVQ